MLLLKLFFQFPVKIFWFSYTLLGPFYRAHYSVNLNSIEVGNSVLKLSSGAFDSGDDKGVIVDSGTTLVYLPDAVYKPLMNEVKAISVTCEFLFVFYYKVLDTFFFLWVFTRFWLRMQSLLCIQFKNRLFVSIIPTSKILTHRFVILGV